MIDNTYLLIAACAVATYITRTAGHVVLSRFGRLHHRVEAALDAVPTAVIAALVAPSLVTQTWAETVSILVAGLAVLRFSLPVSVALGMAVLVACRALV